MAIRLFLLPFVIVATGIACTSYDPSGSDARASCFANETSLLLPSRNLAEAVGTAESTVGITIGLPVRLQTLFGAATPRTGLIPAAGQPDQGFAVQFGTVDEGGAALLVFFAKRPRCDLLAEVDWTTRQVGSTDVALTSAGHWDDTLFEGQRGAFQTDGAYVEASLFWRTEHAPSERVQVETLMEVATLIARS